jgi:hypothetical protein
MSAQHGPGVQALSPVRPVTAAPAGRAAVRGHGTVTGPAGIALGRGRIREPEHAEQAPHGGARLVPVGFGPGGTTLGRGCARKDVRRLTRERPDRGAWPVVGNGSGLRSAARDGGQRVPCTRRNGR